MAPTIVMPEIAFDPDMSGVCSVGGTLVMSSNPTNAARTNTTIPRTIGSRVSSLEATCAAEDAPARINIMSAPPALLGPGRP